MTNYKLGDCVSDIEGETIVFQICTNEQDQMGKLITDLKEAVKLSKHLKANGEYDNSDDSFCTYMPITPIG